MTSRCVIDMPPQLIIVPDNFWLAVLVTLLEIYHTFVYNLI